MPTETSATATKRAAAASNLPTLITKSRKHRIKLTKTGPERLIAKWPLHPSPVVVVNVNNLNGGWCARWSTGLRFIFLHFFFPRREAERKNNGPIPTRAEKLVPNMQLIHAHTHRVCARVLVKYCAPTRDVSSTKYCPPTKQRVGHDDHLHLHRCKRRRVRA